MTENRFSHLAMIGQARAYLQSEASDGYAAEQHPGDRACTIEHWKALARRTRDWFPAPALPADRQGAGA